MIAFYRILMLSVVVRLRLKADQCKAFLLYFAGFARMFRKIAHQNAVKQRTYKMALKRFTLDPCMIIGSDRSGVSVASLIYSIRKHSV